MFKQLVMKDAPTQSEPLGTLSAAEAMDGEAPRARLMRERAEFEHYEARGYRESLERALREALPEDFDFSRVLEFVDWQTRELRARDRLERLRIFGR